jgi:signal transduction histidine kinase
LQNIKASEKNISIETYADRTLKSKINPSLVEQAVVNLIDNAINYSMMVGK